MTGKELGQQPAFPCEYKHWEFQDAKHLLGLTKREYFAGLAMQGMAYQSLISDQSFEDTFLEAGNKMEDFERYCAHLWTGTADALLEQLAKDL